MMQWPPKRAESGELVAGLGFLGSHRRADDKANAQELFAAGFCLTVGSVSEERFILSADDFNRTVVSLIPGITPLASWGGVSGCALFSVVDKNPRDFLGTDKEVLGQGKDAVIMVAHADFINADGTVDYSRMPWR